MKILYVEDNDDNAYMLKNRLTRAGFTVIIGDRRGAGRCHGGVGAARPRLPDIDGEEVSRRIKTDPKPSAFRSLRSPPMRCPATGRGHWRPDATTSTPSRSSSIGCSVRMLALSASAP